MPEEAKIKTAVKRVVRGVLRPLDLEVRRVGSRIPPPWAGPTCEDRLRLLRDLNFRPKVIYDCGAFIGRWARGVSATFPDAHFVLIEPNIELVTQIRENTAEYKDRTTFVNVAVSDENGTDHLNIWDNSKHDNPVTAKAASSLLDHVQGVPTKILEVSTRTIDSLAEELEKPPDLLKLDLQGGELKALLGAEKVLGSTEVCIVEFGCLEAYVARTTARDLMDLFYDHDFCLYDVVDLRYRPYDNALTGGDFFFVKNGSPLRAHKDYF